jgi:hypothetical protein
MTRQDKVALRCPNCGSLAAGRVVHEDRMAGRASVQCIMCKKAVAVPVPDPFWKSFFKETRQTLGVYGAALRAMGWMMVVLLLSVWIGGWYLISYVLHWPSWLAALVPGLPFIFVFSRHFAPRMRAQVSGELGVLRVPRSLRGMSERDPIPVKKPGEAVRLARNRPCVNCGGSYQVGSHDLVLPHSSLDRLRFRLTGRASRMFERVEVTCKKCGNHGYFYFDISSLDLVRKHGYTRTLLQIFPRNQ